MNKVVIVTGGARGIGRQIVKDLVEKGYNVIANYNKSEKEAINLKEELKQHNMHIDIFKADVSKREQVNNLLAFVIGKYRKIDAVINNAGIDLVKTFLDVTDVEWNTMMKNNLNSVFYMCQEALKYMVHKKCGCIINISSIWGLTGASCESAYSVTKAGIDALTKSLAKEFGPSNIRINSIAPGIIDTQMNEFLSEEEKKQVINEIPLEKIGSVKDVSKCALWLLEDEYVTGQVISVNGGWLI